jgi:hypothetical protein
MYEIRRAWVVAVLAGILGAGGVNNPAHAEIVLVPATDRAYGLLVSQDPNPSAYGFLSDNPLQISTGNVDVSYVNSLTSIQFTYTFNVADAVGFVGTGYSSPDSPGVISELGPLVFAIVGTSGEAHGTQVYLDFVSTFQHANNGFFLSNEVDGHYYGGTINHTFLDYRVGDTFTYDTRVGFIAGNSGGFQSAFTLRPALGAAAAPEPGTLALFSMGALPLTHFRGRRRAKRLPIIRTSA